LTELRRPELLDPKRHDRSRFDCGDESLNDWLRRFSGQSRRAHTAATWVIAARDDVVIAYASLSMSSISLAAAPPALAKHSPDPVPALLCGRLGVDRQYAGLGVGTALAAHILAAAVEMNQTAAMKAVVVTAISPEARDWWARFGFEPLDPSPACLDLYLLTKDIERTLKALRSEPA
jgi:GNAT superfamily N-acetyltransferase